MEFLNDCESLKQLAVSLDAEISQLAIRNMTEWPVGASRFKGIWFILPARAVPLILGLRHSEESNVQSIKQ